MSIEKPSHDDFRETPVIAGLRETAEVGQVVSGPARRLLRAGGLMSWWAYGIPFAMMAAHYVLQQRWPDIFQTFWAYLAMVAAFGFFAWKHLGMPRARANARELRERLGGFEDTAAMRAALERQWRER